MQGVEVSTGLGPEGWAGIDQLLTYIYIYIYIWAGVPGSVSYVHSAHAVSNSAWQELASRSWSCCSVKMVEVKHAVALYCHYNVFVLKGNVEFISHIWEICFIYYHVTILLKSRSN
jgi:hypothetical protein